MFLKICSSDKPSGRTADGELEVRSPEERTLLVDLHQTILVFRPVIDLFNDRLILPLGRA